MDTIAEQGKVKAKIGQMAQQQMQQEQEAAAQPQIDPKTRNEIASDNMKAATDIKRKDELAISRTEQADKQIDNKHEQKMAQIAQGND